MRIRIKNLFATLMVGVLLLLWQLSRYTIDTKHMQIFEEKINKTMFVALSVDTTQDFSYLAPFSAEAWVHCGIIPVFILIDSEKSWKSNPTTNLTVSYLLKLRPNITIQFLNDPALLQRFGNKFISTIARIAVPSLLKEMRANPESILLMGDIDVIPLRCDYFKQIPVIMERYKLDVYMDLVVDRSMPRFAMCYIGAQLHKWYQLVPPEFSVAETLKQVLKKSNYPAAYETKTFRHPIMNFDEKYLSQRIKRMNCFPNCTSFNMNVRNYKELIRGPLGRVFNWTETFQRSPAETLTFLSKLIEAHVGSGPFSLYGKESWPILQGLVSMFMGNEITAHLTQYAERYFKLAT